MTVSTIGTDQQIADAIRYQQVLRFYAHQMRAMDSGDAHTWAQTFTEDGVFEANAHPHPQIGRDVILAKAIEAAADLAARGIQRRHWLHMIEVDAQPDGTLHTQYYAVVLSTPVGGAAGVQLSCAGRDIIEVDGDVLRVRHRSVTRDDLPRTADV